MLVIFALLGWVFCRSVINRPEEDEYDNPIVYGYQEMMEIINNKTNGEYFDENTARSAYECIREAVMNSGFYDDYKNPPEKYKYLKMDQVAYLDKEIGYLPESGTFNKTYNTASEFAQKVTKSFVHFKDRHQKCEFKNSKQYPYIYVMPFVAQPSFDKTKRRTYFSFQKVLDSKYSEGKSEYYKLYTFYKDRIGSEEWQCNNGNGPEELNGRVIDKIAGILPNGQTDQALDPIEFFKQYALSEDNYSKDDVGANVLHSIYNIKSGKVGETGMPKYMGLKYFFSYPEESVDFITCEIPYIFIDKNFEDIGEESNEEESDDDCSLGFASLERILVDESIYDMRYSLSIWTIVDNTKLKCALLVLPSMPNPNDPDKSDAREIILNIKFGLMKEIDNIDKLIVDVRGNGGGYPQFASYLTSWFNWDVSEPHSRYLRMRATDYNKKQSESIDWGDKLYDIYDHRKEWYRDELFDLENIEGLIFSDGIAEGKNYTSNYTKLFTSQNEDIYIGETYGYAIKGMSYSEILDLDPIDVVIITDGMCGSACATFYWNAFRNKSAIIFNTGKIVVSNQNGEEEIIIPSAASFAGGQKITITCSDFGPYSSEVGYLPVKEYLNEYDSVPLEFKYGESDVAIPRYSTIYKIMNSRDDYPDEICQGSDIIDEVYSLVFNNHDWGAKPRIPDAKRPESPEIDGDWVVGYEWNDKENIYSCENSENGENSCKVKLYCKAGYYEDQKDHTCKQLSSYENDIIQAAEEVAAYNKTATEALEQTKKAEELVRIAQEGAREADERASSLEQSNTTFMAFMIVFCVLFVATIIVLILVLFGVIPSPVVRKGRGESLVKEVQPVDV